MRFYGFGNYYLSSLQQGLQAAHTVAELFTKYQTDSVQKSVLYNWADEHKTMVLLNGGNSLDLINLKSHFEYLQELGMHLPFSYFKEDEQSLNNAVTYVGIVVPGKYYEIASEIRKLRETEKNIFLESLILPAWELALIDVLNSYKLAS